MILTRTPYRISFFGGGTDYPTWSDAHGGAVLSTSIDKYCHVLVRNFPPVFEEGTIRVVWRKIEIADHVDKIEHAAVRGVCKFFDITTGIEIHHAGDLPSRSGLGAGSSFVVGCLQAIGALKGKKYDKHSLTLDAIYVERDIMKDSVGSQDQTAAAYGGFNKVTFKKDGEIVVEPLAVAPATMEEFQNHLMLFFTGTSRSASEVAAAQIKNTASKERELNAMYAMVDEAAGYLAKGDIDTVGKMLHESWQLKRSLSPLITNSQIDEIYSAGRDAGALGGKLLGAGAGGFILFYASPAVQPKIRERLKNLLYVPFRFEHDGSKIMHNDDTAIS